MKYVMFQLKAEGKPTQHLPVIFPDDFTHADVAKAVEHVRVMPEGQFAGWWAWPKAVSAGFVAGGVCRGYSESLKLGVHSDDTAILKSCEDNGAGARGFAERQSPR